MNSILDDSSKFEKLGSVEENDNTLTIEKIIQRRLLVYLNGNIIQQAVYNNIRPSRSQRPRLYGLPKTHKTDIPLALFFLWLVHSNMSWQNFYRLLSNLSLSSTHPSVFKTLSRLLI